MNASVSIGYTHFDNISYLNYDKKKVLIFETRMLKSDKTIL